MMRPLINQRGFTLIETLIAVAILGGVSFLTMKLVQDQSTNQAYLKAMTEINKTTSIIESHLNHPERCLEMIGNKLVTGTGMPLGTSGVKDVSLMGFNHPTQVPASKIVLLGENNYGDFSIPDNGIVLKTSTFGVAVADIEIHFRMNVAGSSRGRDAAGNKELVKVIPLVVSLNAGKITSCGPALSDSSISALEQTCTNLGAAATWDPVAQQCRMAAFTCPVGQVITGMPKFGTYTCGDLSDKIAPVLDRYFDTTPVDCTNKKNFNVIRSGDKYKINCI